MIRTLARAAALAAASVLAAAGPAAAAELLCPGRALTVTAGDAAVAERVCRVAERFAPRLAECGLSRARMIRLAVVPSVAPDQPHCLGSFNCETWRIAVTGPAALAGGERPDDAFGAMAPVAEFESLVVHELAHAAFAETVGEAFHGRAVHEYVAYALQVDAMAEADRAAFLERYAGAPDEGLEQFNTFVLALAPGAFAARAWRHFSAPGNGCAFVRGIVAGEVVFPTLY